MGMASAARMHDKETVASFPRKKKGRRERKGLSVRSSAAHDRKVLPLSAGLARCLPGGAGGAVGKLVSFIFPCFTIEDGMTIEVHCKTEELLKIVRLKFIRTNFFI